MDLLWQGQRMSMRWWYMLNKYCKFRSLRNSGNASSLIRVAERQPASQTDSQTNEWTVVWGPHNASLAYRSSSPSSSWGVVMSLGMEMGRFMIMLKARFKCQQTSLSVGGGWMMVIWARAERFLWTWEYVHEDTVVYHGSKRRCTVVPELWDLSLIHSF